MSRLDGRRRTNQHAVSVSRGDTVTFSWFDKTWCWIGLFAAAVVLLMLFGGDRLRGDRTRSRWRDPLWLAWLAPVAYAIHQAEEYGVTLFGTRFAFPDVLCHMLGQPPYPGCTIPTAVFVAVNIPMIWVLGAVGILGARRYPLMGLGIYGVHATNALSHIGTMITSQAYNPGVFTACVIQLPVSIWVAYATVGDRRIGASGLITLFAAGLLVSGVLLAGLKLFVAHVISGAALLWIEALNPVLIIALTWVKARGAAHAPAMAP